MCMDPAYSGIPFGQTRVQMLQCSTLSLSIYTHSMRPLFLFTDNEIVTTKKFA